MKPNLFKTLLWHDVLIYFRRRGDLTLTLFYWVLFAAFFPLATSAAPQLLLTISSGVIWLGMLLAQLLNLSKVFREEHQEGILAEYIASPHDFFMIILCKLFNFWLITYLPFLLLSPLLGIMFQMPWATIKILMLTILLGSPSLALLSSFIASLTISLRNNGLLLNILYLPLTIPVIIFATHAINFSMQGLSNPAAIAWLAVILILSLLILPFATTKALLANFN
jgi:heme exporter protein B